jgi:hypothetical protein
MGLRIRLSRQTLAVLDALLGRGILKDAEFEVVESDSRWISLMERACGAPPEAE